MRKRKPRNYIYKLRANTLAEEGYIGVALDLFGAEAILDGIEDYRKETSFLYKNRKEFKKKLRVEK